MICFTWVILLNSFLLTISGAIPYLKPDYPKRPLSKEENQNLLRSCGRPPVGQSHQKVWNPDYVNRTEAHWSVAVLSAAKWTPNMTVEEMCFICSGSLISSRHVITATHCIKPNMLHHYFVIDVQCAINSRKCHGEPMYLRTAARVFSSVRYTEVNIGPYDNNGGDMAVFELTEDIPFSENVWPVCLGDTSLLLGEALDLYGYGTHGINNPTYSLQHAPIVLAECPENLKWIYYVASYHIRSRAGGAGLIQTDSHGRKFVAATHTAGWPCEETNKDTVFGPNSTNHRKLHTVVKPHLYWICEATGICANEEIEKDIEIWINLPNRHRERFVVQEPLEEKDIYV